VIRWHIACGLGSFVSQDMVEKMINGKIKWMMLITIFLIDAYNIMAGKCYKCHNALLEGICPMYMKYDFLPLYASSACV
jgi:hypothetical protein